MKKLSLILLSLSLSLVAFAQNDLKVDFCSKSANEIKIKDLLNCKLISVNNPDYKVASYTLGFKTGKDYKEFKFSDNALSEKAIEIIKSHNPSVVYIEQIVLINKQGEKVKPTENCAKINR
jgi:hypothetical protein